MRILGISFLVFIGILSCLNILGRKLNKEIVILNQSLKKQNEILKKTILHIQMQLILTTLEQCPEEEKDNIVKENIDFINEIKEIW